MRTSSTEAIARCGAAVVGRYRPLPRYALESLRLCGTRKAGHISVRTAGGPISKRIAPLLIQRGSGIARNCATREKNRNLLPPCRGDWLTALAEWKEANRESTTTAARRNAGSTSKSGCESTGNCRQADRVRRTVGASNAREATVSVRSNATALTLSPSWWMPAMRSGCVR